MATRSRTYLPTDWKVWTYKPVAGKFRLDFSTLNGSDVLGGVSDTGSIQEFNLSINSIQLQDGQRPQQSVFGSFEAGTMDLSAQLLTYDSTIVQELYNGKEIFLTLKNESTDSHPVFGTNTVFFIGQIENLDIQVDPVNLITNLVISATDIASAAMNVPMTILKSNATTKDVQLGTATDLLVSQGRISSYTDFNFLGVLSSTYELNVTETKSVGEWMSDYISSELAVYVPYYFQYPTIPQTVKRNASFFTITDLVKNGELIPNSVITNFGIGQDGANVPTAFNLSNSSDSYSFGIESESVRGNPNIYSDQIDVPLVGLTNVASQILKYSQKIQPIELTVQTARTYQTITFDNTRPFGALSNYFYPKYFYANGQEVSTNPEFTGETYYHQIVGTTHLITPDDWQTTYQLLKGL